MIKITKQQQKLQPFDNNWFDFGGRESLIIFLAVTLWVRPHAHTNTIPFDSHQRKRTKIWVFPWANIQKLYKHSCSSREFHHVHCEFTKHHVNICQYVIYAHPVFIFFQVTRDCQGSLGEAVFGRDAYGPARFVGSWSWVLGAWPPPQDASHHQDYAISNRKNPYPPLLPTVTGRGPHPKKTVTIWL